MLAYTYIEKGKFALVEKPKPTLIEPTDAIVRVTMGSILHQLTQPADHPVSIYHPEGEYLKGLVLYVE